MDPRPKRTGADRVSRGINTFDTRQDITMLEGDHGSFRPDARASHGGNPAGSVSSDAAVSALARRVTRSVAAASAASVVALCATLAAMGPAWAAAPVTAGSFRDGLWELTIRAEVAGAPSRPPISLKKCVSAKEIQDLQARVSRPPQSESCKVFDQRTQGGTTRWKMACTGRMTIAGEGSLTSSGDSYALQWTMVVTGEDNKAMQVTNALTGRRLGDCVPATP